MDDHSARHAEKENLRSPPLWPADALPMPPSKTSNTTCRRRRCSDTFVSSISITSPPMSSEANVENRRSFELKQSAMYSMQTDGTLEQLSALEKMRASEGFAAKQSLWRRLAIQSSPEDTSEKELIHRSTLIIISTFTVLAGLIWGGMYVALGEYLAALCPAIYSCLMGLTLAICICHNNQFGYGIFAKCQLTLILVLPFAVHVALGGVQESGCVMLWSFLCPMGSAFFRSAKEAVRWFYVYLSLSLALLAMDFQEQSSKHSDNDAIRESKIESLYFTMNILGVMSVVFIVVFLFARDLEHEYAQSEEVLTNIMPKPIVIRIKRGEFPIVDHLSEVCILFADLVGFTKASAEHHPNFLIGLFLRDVFLEFDRCVEKHGLEKIKTIGDAYMVVGGIDNGERSKSRTDPPHAAPTMLLLAVDFFNALEKINKKYNLKFTLRAGVNVGPVVAGVLGLKRFTYDVWGDSVNTASRMESNGLPGHVHLSSQMYEMVKHLSDVFEFSCRGNIQIKGKGEMITYLARPRIRERAAE